MALAVGTTTLSNATTFSHTVAAATELLIVSTAFVRAAGRTTVSSIAWNGASLTVAKANGGNGTEEAAEIWYLVSPTPATGNVVITYAAAADGQRSYAANITGGVTIASPIGATFSNNTAGSESTVMTPTSNRGMFVDMIVINDAGSFTAGAGMTAIQTSTLVVASYPSAGGYILHTGSNTTVAWTGISSPSHTIVEIKGSQYNQPMTEIATISDALIKTTQKVFSDTATMTATLFQAGKTRFQTLTDTIHVTDLLSLIYNGSATIWRAAAKAAATFSNATKHAASWSNSSKHSSSFNNQTKN